MCNACIMESVRASVRAHPTAFERSATAAAAFAAGALAARENLTRCRGRVIDLTHPYDETFPTFDGPPGFTKKQVATFANDGFNVFRLTIDEHTGTHVDAPLHITADGASLTGLDPQNLICPLCVIDISAKAREDVNATLTAHDVEAWMARHGKIPQGA
jgi:kynurenine formamidase